MKFTLLEPLGIVNGLTGLNVTVPADVLASVTVRAASVVLAFPNESCLCTVIVPDATPAVTVTAEVVKRSEDRRVGKEGRSRWSAYHLNRTVLAAVIVGVPDWVSV